jgi:hypothetical protein
MSGAGLELTLDIAQPVVAGLPAFALLHVINRGAGPRIVSARLNLMEGDVALAVEDPEGGVRQVRGWQADTSLRRVELPPGCQLVGALLLLETPEGMIFPGPGEYRLSAQYTPQPQEQPAVTAAVAVAVVPPRSAEERALASLLADPAVRRAILLADPESAPAQLREIGDRFGSILAGRLARLVSGAAEPAGPDPIPDALAILALRNPYGRTGARLAESYAARLDRADAGADGELARRLTKTEPIPADARFTVPA